MDKNILNHNDKIEHNDLIACHGCDLLFQRKHHSHLGMAKCNRCGAVLFNNKPASIDRTLPLIVAALVFFIIANTFPFLSIQVKSQFRGTNLITGIIELYSQKMIGLSILVLLTTIIVPFCHIMGMLYILIPLKIKFKFPFWIPIFRFITFIQPWGMIEIFMVGILVAMVKILKMAHVLPGIAIYSFLALIITLACTTLMFDPHQIWQEWSDAP